jgi:hypothetical protein
LWLQLSAALGWHAEALWHLERFHQAVVVGMESMEVYWSVVGCGGGGGGGGSHSRAEVVGWWW